MAPNRIPMFANVHDNNILALLSNIRRGEQVSNDTIPLKIVRKIKL